MSPLVQKLSILCIYLLGCLPVTLHGQITDASLQYEINQAALVMVRMEIRAEVNVQKVNINSRSFNRLLDSIQSLEQDSIFLSPSEKLEIVLNEFQARPQYYFVSEFTYFRHREKVSARGTGFIISGDGYVLTNCHVVDEGDAFISRRFVLSAFNYVTESNINAIEQAWVVKFTEQQRNQLYQTFANVYSRIVPIELEKIEKTIFVTLNAEDSTGRLLSREFQASIVQKGRSMPGKDVALLKISTPEQLPSLRLEEPDAVKVGEEVFAYGFPNPVANNIYLSDETILEPTLTRGIISARKKTVNGWPVLQMDADINRGNSGGPVCNKKGEVIGITTFGTLDDNARGLAPGLNFAIPLEVVREFIPDSISHGLSTVSLKYAAAIALEEKGAYKKALHYFEEVRQLNPFYPGLHQHIRNAEQEIRNGHDSTANSWILFAVIAGLAAMTGLVFWWKYGSKK